MNNTNKILALTLITMGIFTVEANVENTEKEPTKELLRKVEERIRELEVEEARINEKIKKLAAETAEEEKIDTEERKEEEEIRRELRKLEKEEVHALPIAMPGEGVPTEEPERANLALERAEEEKTTPVSPAYPASSMPVSPAYPISSVSSAYPVSR